MRRSAWFRTQGGEKQLSQVVVGEERAARNRPRTSWKLLRAPAPCVIKVKGRPDPLPGTDLLTGAEPLALSLSFVHNSSPMQLCRTISPTHKNLPTAQILLNGHSVAASLPGLLPLADRQSGGLLTNRGFQVFVTCDGQSWQSICVTGPGPWDRTWFLRATARCQHFMIFCIWCFSHCSSCSAGL